MVVKAGGYFISLENAKEWLRKEDELYHPEEDSDIGWKTQNFLEDNKIKAFFGTFVLHPETNEAILLFGMDIKNDIHSTFHNCIPFQEKAVNLYWKDKLLGYTGLKEEEVEWITIPDPFMKDPARYVRPRAS